MKSKNNTYLWKIKLLTALTLLSLQGYSASSYAADKLVIADNKGDWGALAPYLHKPKGKGYVYTSFVFDTLLWKDKKGKPQPALATQWSINDTGLCYNFTLNQKARWHDGEPLEADDVAFTFEYMTKHRYHFADMSRIKTATALNKEQVEVCLTKPHAPFLTNIAANIPILPKHLYQGVKKPKRFRDAAATIGSGPYRLVNYDRAQGRYHLQRNDDYYAWKPRYKEVHIVKMSEDAALTAMQRGDVHLMKISAKTVDHFKKAGIPLRSRLSNHPRRILFNHKEQFKDPAVRRALAQIIDREALIKLAYLGHAKVASAGYFQPEPIAHKLNPYAYNPEQATKELLEAGWKKSAEGQWLANNEKVTVDFMAAPKFKLLAKAIAKQFESFGIGVNLRLEKGAKLTHRLRTHDFGIALLSLSHEGDSDRFRRLIASPSALSDGYFANEELIKRLEQQASAQTPEERQQFLAQAETIYNQDLPSIPLVNPMSFLAFVPNQVNPIFTEKGIASGLPLGMDKVQLFAPNNNKQD